MRTLSLLFGLVMLALFAVPDQADAAGRARARRWPPRPPAAIGISHGFAVHAADLRTLRVRRGLDFDPSLHYGSGYRVGLSTYRTQAVQLVADPGVDPCYQPPAPVVGVVRAAVQLQAPVQAPAPPASVTTTTTTTTQP